MNKRTNTAQWEEKYQRWRIAVQKDGVRKQFYSSTPGRTGQREANAKADAWLENDIAVKAGRVENVYQLWIDDLKLTTSTGNWKPVESRWRTWVLPIIGKKKVNTLTDRDLQTIINKAAAAGKSRKTLQLIASDLRAFCKYCRKAKLSTFLPEDVQIAMYRSVPGLEHAQIVRNAYAIEYDCIDARNLTLALEFKKISGLFSAGQFNGSSGYEEAAAQGLIAGINAARKIQGKEPLVLDRSEAYIGVLIDDLVTKENREPYRMMTSRAEYRLLLRQDNADLRLTKKGYEVGLISEERYQKLLKKEQEIEAETRRVEATHIGANAKVQACLKEHGSTSLKTSASLAELIRRPELSYEALGEIDTERPNLPADVCEEVNINIKYAGYLERQMKQVE